jgi:hypothetical protein
MSKSKPAQSFGPNLLDVRVRERYLANGLLQASALEKYESELPDVASKSETILLLQPALTGDEEEGEEGDE